jgi:hypothetical protein
MRGTVGAAQMKSVLDAVLFLAWVTGYLAAVAWVVRYRKMKVGALGATRHTDYRGDKDLTLRLTIFALGVAMLLVGYIATRMVGQQF